VALATEYDQVGEADMVEGFAGVDARRGLVDAQCLERLTMPADRQRGVEDEDAPQEDEQRPGDHPHP